MDIKEIIFTYGELYGRLCTRNPHYNTAARFSMAMSYPHKSFTLIYLTSIKNHTLRFSDEEYVKSKIDQIDVSKIPTDPIPSELQNSFLSGFYKGQNSIKVGD